MSEVPTQFRFGVMDTKINGLSIEALVLSAKCGSKMAKAIHRGLHDFIADLERVMDEKYGEGTFDDYCKKLEEGVSEQLGKVFDTPAECEKEGRE